MAVHASSVYGTPPIWRKTTGSLRHLSAPPTYTPKPYQCSGSLNWESKPHKMSSDCNFWAPVWSLARANFEVYCSCGQTFLVCPFHMGIFQTCSLWPGRSDSYVARRISLWPAVTRFQHPDTRSLHSVDGYHPLALAPAQPGYWPG